MQLVLGLGNPGPRYAGTRHNVGFRCVEALAARLQLAFDDRPGPFRAAVGEGPAGPVTLLQPLTYMNRSDEGLLAWARREDYRVAAAGTLAEPDERLVVPIVVCDDLNLGLGALRVRGRGGAGGQKGLAAIIAAAGGEDLPRVRLGVGPLDGAVDPERWADHVLEDFEPQERPLVEEMIARGAEAVQCLLACGWLEAASRFNRRAGVDTDG